MKNFLLAILLNGIFYYNFADSQNIVLTSIKTASESINTNQLESNIKSIESRILSESASSISKPEKGFFNTIISWFSNSNSNKSKQIKQQLPPVIIALALGGGAAKGFAHIGVIKALEENGIKPQIITGTSAGSLVGSLYAYGYSAQQLEQISYQMDELNLADFTFSKKGLLKGQKLQDFVNNKINNTNIQNLKYKFTAIATDLDSGQSVAFNYGNTGVAVRASCSVPNIFIPVIIANHRYVDGGLSAPVPVTYAANMGANLIIAVDITSKPQNTKATGFLSNLDQTINIMGVKLLNEQLKSAHFIIAPDISKLSSFAFDQKKQAIDLGYKATLQIIPQIKARIVQMQENTFTN